MTIAALLQLLPYEVEIAADGPPYRIWRCDFAPHAEPCDHDLCGFGRALLARLGVPGPLRAIRYEKGCYRERRAARTAVYDPATETVTVVDVIDVPLQHDHGERYVVEVAL